MPAAIVIEAVGGVRRAQVAWAGARLARALRAIPVRATRARVRFADDDGPKGGVAVRCGLTVKLPRRPPLHAEAVAATPRAAFDDAVAALEATLARRREIGRSLRRHPKKYFVAARLRTAL